VRTITGTIRAGVARVGLSRVTKPMTLISVVLEFIFLSYPPDRFFTLMWWALAFGIACGLLAYLVM